MSEKEAKEKVSGLVSGDWEIFESSSKALTEGSTTLEKDDFIFERMIDGVPVNYVRETSLPVNEQALEWENEDRTLHEGQSEGWENEVLTMDFCSGTLQSFLHRNPIEASNASDERLFLLPFDEVKDIFEKYNRLLPEKIRTGYRFRLLYLRSVIDYELMNLSDHLKCPVLL